MDERKLDKRRLRESAAVLRGMVERGKPEWSVRQLAGVLTGGVDDGHSVGESALYKALEGERAFWLHKIPAIVNALGDTSVVEWLCREVGLVGVRPAGGECLERASIRRVMQEGSEAVRVACEAISPEGAGGEEVTAGELRVCRERIHAAVGALVKLELELVGRVKRD